jgi:hypothetical protein
LPLGRQRRATRGAAALADKGRRKRANQKKENREKRKAGKVMNMGPATDRATP